jgi:hypothetical protein
MIFLFTLKKDHPPALQPDFPSEIDGKSWIKSYIAFHAAKPLCLINIDAIRKMS